MKQRKSNNKYFNKKVVVGNITFDSEKEYRYYQTLLLKQRAGLISDLQRQVKFELIPAQYEEYETQLKTKVRIDKRCVERSVCYYADYAFVEDGKYVVVDCKSEMTRQLHEYIIKRKLMLFVHNVKILEI